MVISKLINNNYVVAANEDAEDDEEVIVKGVGVGYKKNIGDMIPTGQIEKIYRLKNGKTLDELSGLLKNIPDNQFQVCDKIIDFARKKLKTELNPNLYVTLTDHVNYAIFRWSKGIQVANPMLNEIKSFYPKEFEIGKYAIMQIRKKLDVDLGEDEAGFIAFHMVNAEANTEMNTTMEITNLVKETIHIIEEYFAIQFNDKDINYRRLVSHLQFIANNVVNNKHAHTSSDVFNQFIFESYPEEAACSKKVADHIKDHFQYELDEDELSYMIVNISRVRKRKKIERKKKNV